LRADETEAAAQIAQALAPELNRWGQRDLSRRLLQQSLPLPKSQAVDQRFAALARLQLEEGPLSDALKVYQEIYESLEPGTETVQRTYVMLRIGHTHQRLGNLEEALAHYLAALRIIRRREKRENRPELATEEAMMSAEGSRVENALSLNAALECVDGASSEETLTAEADCLAHLASVHRQVGNLKEALVFSQASKEQYETLESARGMAAAEHEQGLILKALSRPESALERFVAGLRICRQTGDRQCMADNLKETGQLFDELGKTDMAIQVIEEAIEHYEYLRSPEHGEVLSLLEELYAKRQSLPEAIERDRTTRHTPE
jgi:tetratricopeptide (TPR) repeat protein